MIDILFEDAEALVIDKPAGLPVEPPRRAGASLADHLDALRLGFARRPSPAHRLDTDTSGCLLLARNPKALKRFHRAFEQRLVQKTYLAIVDGPLDAPGGTIALALAKISSRARGWRMIAAKKGKPAITHWELVERVGDLSLVRFRPETGRTHQLRVHACEGLGYPLLGDPIYGPSDARARDASRGDGAGGSRTMLHAESLTLEREGKRKIEALAPLPQDFEKALGRAAPLAETRDG